MMHMLQLEERELENMSYIKSPIVTNYLIKSYIALCIRSPIAT